ncbi:MAG TPA: polysaccharide deacetylase family protein [Thermoanaerobaculia bacterium]|nr:polysaccharide deacetylase family protein [Thermoanaerobaculia bacterium]
MRRFLAALFFAPALFTAEPQVAILGYHQVDAVPEVGWTVSNEDFVDQMRYLQLAGFHVVPIAEFYDWMTGKRPSLPANAVVVTADDGFADQYTDLNRLIQPFGFPWSLYIYPHFINTHGATALTWPQVDQLVAAGVDVESHTMTHPHLIRKSHLDMSDVQYAQWLQKELADSKRVIAERKRKPVRFLCYPYGDWNARVAAEAARAGYVLALTSWAGLNTRSTNLFELRRSLIMSDTSLGAFTQAAGALPLAIRDASPASDSVATLQTISATIVDPHDVDPATVRIALLGELGSAKYHPATGRVTWTQSKFTRGREQVVVWGQRASDRRVVTAVWTFYTSANAKQQYAAAARAAAPSHRDEAAVERYFFVAFILLM